MQGHALGGGAGLVAAADIAIAAPDAVFSFSEVKLGIIPAVISPFALARIGPGAARRYFVTGERFDAETALRIGLVHEVAEDLDAAVERVVGELLSAGPQAARWAKRLVRERPDGPETARWIAERRTSDEGQEGLRAFLEKRPPSWRSVLGLELLREGRHLVDVHREPHTRVERLDQLRRLRAADERGELRRRDLGALRVPAAGGQHRAGRLRREDERELLASGRHDEVVVLDARARERSALRALLLARWRRSRARRPGRARA